MARAGGSWNEYCIGNPFRMWGPWMGNMATSFFGMFRGANQDDPLASVKAVRAWATGLPANDPLGGLEAIVRLLENLGATQPAVTANRIQALLTLDQLSLPLQTDVLVQYRLPTLSDDVRRRLWHACNDMARWFAYAYEHVYGGFGAGEDRSRPRQAAHAILARMFYYRGLQAKLGLFHYESWIPGSWRFLHNAYREACDLGVATEPYALAETGGRFSTEQEYLQILLLQRVNSGNLTAQQVEWVALWLRGWVGALRLAAPPATGEGFWLDLGQGEGLLAKRPDSGAPDLLYLDVRPLHEQLAAFIARLEAELARSNAAQPDYRALDEQLRLARRVQALWQPQAQPRARRGERRAERRPVVVAAGWPAIIAAMRTGGSRRSSESHQYTYDDVLRLATLGKPQELQRDRYGNLVGRETDRHAWQVHDTSESGVRILSTAKEAQKLQIGALLALQADGDTRWQIGIVRRLRRRTADNTELGVEVISRHALTTTVTPPAARDSGYSVDGVDVSTRGSGFQGLYLSPQEHARFLPVRSLILPASEFAPGRNLTINVGAEVHDIRLFAPLEQSKDWVWTAFDIVLPATPV